MNLEEFETKAKALIANVSEKAEALWAAIPAEFAHPALEAAKAGVDDLVDFGAVEVEKVAPQSLDAVIEAAKAKILADANEKIAALDSAKAAVAA